MNYFEFLEFYHLDDNEKSFSLFIDFRNLADIITDCEAVKIFEF